MSQNPVHPNAIKKLSMNPTTCWAVSRKESLRIADMVYWEMMFCPTVVHKDETILDRVVCNPTIHVRKIHGG